jgi:hypothetical protein
MVMLASTKSHVYLKHADVYSLRDTISAGLWCLQKKEHTHALKSLRWAVDVMLAYEVSAFPDPVTPSPGARKCSSPKRNFKRMRTEVRFTGSFFPSIEEIFRDPVYATGVISARPAPASHSKSRLGMLRE